MDTRFHIVADLIRAGVTTREAERLADQAVRSGPAAEQARAEIARLQVEAWPKHEPPALRSTA